MMYSVSATGCTMVSLRANRTTQPLKSGLTVLRCRHWLMKMCCAILKRVAGQPVTRLRIAQHIFISQCLHRKTVSPVFSGCVVLLARRLTIVQPVAETEYIIKIDPHYREMPFARQNRVMVLTRRPRTGNTAVNAGHHLRAIELFWIVGRHGIQERGVLVVVNLVFA